MSCYHVVLRVKKHGLTGLIPFPIGALHISKFLEPPMESSFKEIPVEWASHMIEFYKTLTRRGLGSKRI